MPISLTRAKWLLRGFQLVTVILASLLLISAVALVIVERGWIREQPMLGPTEAFYHGTIGTELLPLPVLEVLPDLFPENFGAGDAWIDRFGFLKSTNGNGLPYGFTVSNRRPQSGAPSPVQFVGFSCVLCHSTDIRETGTDAHHFVVGPGSVSLNLFAWIDELQASALDEKRFTLDAVEKAYEKRPGGRTLSTSEKIMIKLWLAGFRKTVQEGLLKYDAPFGGDQSLLPDSVPTGPTRTQPFRTIVRRVMNRPGTSMSVYTKIATVYQERLREWSQFDGSIRDLNARSGMAAFAAGATPDNLAIPEIANNVKQASEFVRTLTGPTYASTFPTRALDPTKVQRGKDIYLNAGPEGPSPITGKPVRFTCDLCHGHPEEAGWKRGDLQGEITPLATIQTDPERVTYRYFDELPDKLYALVTVQVSRTRWGR